MTIAARTPNCHGGTESEAPGGGAPPPASTSFPRLRPAQGGLALPCVAHPHHVPGQAAGLEPADHHGRRVDLPAPEAVARRRGEGVVVVVPGLAEREERQPEDVARLVRGGVAAPPEDVADRVDAV